MDFHRLGKWAQVLGRTGGLGCSVHSVSSEHELLFEWFDWEGFLIFYSLVLPPLLIVQVTCLIFFDWEGFFDILFILVWTRRRCLVIVQGVEQQVVVWLDCVWYSQLLFVPDDCSSAPPTDNIFSWNVNKKSKPRTLSCRAFNCCKLQLFCRIQLSGSWQWPSGRKLERGRVGVLSIFSQRRCHPVHCKANMQIWWTYWFRSKRFRNHYACA